MPDRIIWKRKGSDSFFQIIDKFLSGVSLRGDEVKSVRNGSVALDKAFVTINGNQAFINGMKIALYKRASVYSRMNYQPERRKQLLLHKKEILEISNKVKARGLVVIPLEVVTRKRWVKLVIALARRLKKHQAKRAKKLEDIARINDRRDYGNFNLSLN